LARGVVFCHGPAFLPSKKTAKLLKRPYFACFYRRINTLHWAYPALSKRRYMFLGSDFHHAEKPLARGQPARIDLIQQAVIADLLYKPVVIKLRGHSFGLRNIFMHLNTTASGCGRGIDPIKRFRRRPFGYTKSLRSRQ
jgi:hypothetical protein